MTEPGIVRPRSLALASLLWTVVGAGVLVFLLVTVFGGNPSSRFGPADGGLLFGAVTVLYCASRLKKGWRGPRIYLAVVAVVLAYVGVRFPVVLLLGDFGPSVVVFALFIAALALIAVVAAVLMFLPDANAFVWASRS